MQEKFLHEYMKHDAMHLVTITKHWTAGRIDIMNKKAQLTLTNPRESMQKLLQFDVFRFISPNFKLPMHSFVRYV